LPPAASSVVLVDTNVLAYLMLEGDRTSAAQELFERDADWRSEAFIMVEFSNVLTTYVRTKVLSRDQGLKLLAGAEKLVPVLTSVQNVRALEVATQFGISAYDARFVALAIQMKVKLVTEDAKLRAVVPSWTVSLADAGA
jgi:predicted nucleic acid-binding protein